MQVQAKKKFVFWFGLDVSKGSFVAACGSLPQLIEGTQPETMAFALNKKGVRAFLKWAGALAGDFEFGVAMEATGVYSRTLSGLISDISPAQHVAVCNALSVSHYARSFSDEKSDKADAAVIARYACERQPQEPRKLSPERERLREIARFRNALVKQKIDATNRLQTLEGGLVRKIQQSFIRKLERDIQTLEKELRNLVKASPDICHEVTLMMTVPGVGFVSAACIYAEYGSLKDYTRKQISALSGVCPVNRQSGTSLDKHAISHKGPKMTRRILFLDSTPAIKGIPALQALHERLLSRPKSSKMTAKCACMRKLLLILHAMVVSDTTFDPNHQSVKNIKNVKKPA